VRSVAVFGAGGSGVAAVGRALLPGRRVPGGTPLAPRAEAPFGYAHSPFLTALLDRCLRPSRRPLPRTSPEFVWLSGARPNRAPSLSVADAEALRQALDGEPFCLAHPALAAAYESIAPLLPADTLRVVVFRELGALLETLAERVAVDPELRLWSREQLAAAVERCYGAVLSAADRGGEWLFLDFDDWLAGAGSARLAQRAGGASDVELEPLAPRRRGRVEVPATLTALYAELQRRAGSTPRPATDDGGPAITALALVDRDQRSALPALAQRVHAQRGVRAELLVVDTSLDGGLELAPSPGLRVLHVPGPSRGAALRAAAAAASTELIALVDPQTTDLPWRLARAAATFAQDPELEFLCADLLLRDEAGRLQSRRYPGAMGDAPAAFWQAGAVVRRAVLARAPTVAFRRSELALYAEARARGRARSLDRPAFHLAREVFAAAEAQARLDGELLALDRAPVAKEPEISVLICTYRRRDTLLECLRAFSRQRGAVGRFELVVVDDGCDDGSAELLDRLELPLPCRVLHRPNGGLAAARNTGLGHCRAPLVLLVNDDTIPFDDCVEQHLLAHGRQDGEQLCVLGTFEQRPAALDNALLRYLEGSWEVFAYSRLRPGERYDAFHFYTCNVSLPTAELRAVGGFDPSFRHYGCEDTDVGLKLEARGLTVLYEARARAHHWHAFDFEYLARRQRTVARAFVRLFRLHPRARLRWEGTPEDRRSIAAELWSEAELARQEAAARTLATLDVGALEPLGEKARTVAADAVEQLGERVRALHRQWWLRGLLEGFDEQGIDGLGQWLAEEEPRYELPTECPRRLLAWPRYDDPRSLLALIGRTAALGGDRRVALVLPHDPERDGDRQAVEASLAAAFARSAVPAPELVLVGGPAADRWHWLRLRRVVDAWLPLGGEPQLFRRECDLEALPDDDAVRLWLQRFAVPAPLPRRHPERPSGGGLSVRPVPVNDPVHGALPRPAAAARRAGPELSVLVPTCDRPRELLQCLEALAAQDLAGERFDVWVVDDGSTQPVEAALTARTWPFALHCLRQERSGPGIARNLALSRSRGEFVVFLNDDAVPRADCLRLHLQAQRGQTADDAVLGAFPLLPARRADAFQELVETRTLLFAQPRLLSGVRYHGRTLCTGNLSLRRDLLERLGGFDAGLPFAGAEDSELGERLERELGGRVRYAPWIVADHDHWLDLPGFVQRQRRLGWCCARLAERHDDASWLDPRLAGRRHSTLPSSYFEQLRSVVRERGEAFVARAAALAAALRPEPRAVQRRLQADRLEPEVEQLRQAAFEQGMCLYRGGTPASALLPPALPPIPLRAGAAALRADRRA
jgi:glycosyltransferase involved in cell wall biosynthesis